MDGQDPTDIAYYESKGFKQITAKVNNPGRRHLAGATAKQQRQYEHILRSELDRGAPLKDAKRIAAATVRAGSKNPKGYSRGRLRYEESKGKVTPIRYVTYQGKTIPARLLPEVWEKAMLEAREYREKAKELSRQGKKEEAAWYREAYAHAAKMAKYLSKRVVQERKEASERLKKYKNPLSAEAEKLAREIGLSKGEMSILATKSPSFQMRFLRKEKATRAAVEKKEAKATTPTQKKAAARAKKSWLSKLGTKLRVMGQTRKFKVEARDLGQCKRKVIKVKSRHETDAVAKAKSQLGSRYDQVRVVNPQLTDLEAKANDLGYRIGKSEKNIPRKIGHEKLKKLLERASSQIEKNGIRYWYERGWNDGWRDRFENPMRKGMRKDYSRAKKQNQTAEQIRKKFTGSVKGERTLYVPDSTPREKLAKLGKLISITTEEGTIKPVAGEAWLLSDTRGHLHLGSLSKAPLYNGPKRSFGKVFKIEYEDVKKHLGYGPTIFFHHMGEENGKRPTLYADGEGGLIFRGGDYEVTANGLVN